MLSSRERESIDTEHTKVISELAEGVNQRKRGLGDPVGVWYGSQGADLEVHRTELRRGTMWPLQATVGPNLLGWIPPLGEFNLRG